MSHTFYKADFPSTVGRLFYVWRDAGSIYFLSSDGEACGTFLESNQVKNPGCEITTKHSDRIEKKIIRYLEKKSRHIDIRPVFISGSSLEKAVWNAAMDVPYGKVASYKDLSSMAGYPNAWRAAGTAIGHNPVMLIVPCHRIIRSDGRIGRYGGGEEIKEFLLNLEQ
jgi:O-6-methylguanine DNA methyltransferase